MLLIQPNVTCSDEESNDVPMVKEEMELENDLKGIYDSTQCVCV